MLGINKFEKKLLIKFERVVFNVVKNSQEIE